MKNAQITSNQNALVVKINMRGIVLISYNLDYMTSQFQLLGRRKGDNRNPFDDVHTINPPTQNGNILHARFTIDGTSTTANQYTIDMELYEVQMGNQVFVAKETLTGSIAMSSGTKAASLGFVIV